MSIDYSIGRASEREVSTHLFRCDDAFIPSLSSRVDIADYARKIVDNAQTFEAWVNDELVGLVAVYCNASDRHTAFITSVSVLYGWQGKGIAGQLMAQCFDHLQALDLACSELEVGTDNEAALYLYKKLGFTIICKNGNTHKMTKVLTKDY